MQPSIQTLFDSHHHVITSAIGAAHGIGSKHFQRLEAGREVIRVARGAYADGAVYRSAASEAQHLIKARGVLASTPEGVALSHHSAAIAWGLPWVGPVPQRVHIIREGHGQQRQSASATLHARIPTARFATREGLRVIEPAFSLFGVAAQHGTDQSVVLLDAGLHEGIIAESDVMRMLVACKGRKGHAVAAAAASLADSASESPGESLTRLLLTSLGYEVRSQVTIKTTSPYFQARVDFMLTHHRIVIEFDGLVKYADGEGSANRQALVREKAREDRIRSLGFEVVRLVWADLYRPERVRSLLEAACIRAIRRAA